jgi:hypothetical protein
MGQSSGYRPLGASFKRKKAEEREKARSSGFL